MVCVLPGGVLPGPFPISGRKTYGHWSDGMICSAKELGLGEDHAGIIVLASPSGESEDLGYDADALTPGQDAIALLGLDEKTIEITITPDRGYCFSIRGVAREYSHSTGAAFRDPAAIELTGTALDPSDAAFAASSAFPVSIEDAGAHSRHRGLRPVRGARAARLRPRGAEPRVDEAPPGAVRHALHLACGGRHQLRDARAGPPPARLRPCQGDRADRGAPGVGRGEAGDAGRRRRASCRPRTSWCATARAGTAPAPSAWAA